jgi:hypothetical protein
MIRVNKVVITRKAGASVSTVSRKKTSSVVETF